MNIDRPSQRRRRSYDNTLRLEQARLTRERILASAVGVLAAAGPRGATLSEVARAARVSEPTLYRHFGSRERLIEALEAYVQEKLGFPALPPSLEDIPAHVDQLFATFEEHAPLLRASVVSGVGREFRTRGRARRIRYLREAVAAAAPDLPPDEVSRVAGVLRALVSWESYETMTGELGLSRREASAAVAWAAEALIAKVRAAGSSSGKAPPAVSSRAKVRAAAPSRAKVRAAASSRAKVGTTRRSARANDGGKRGPAGGAVGKKRGKRKPTSATGED